MLDWPVHHVGLTNTMLDWPVHHPCWTDQYTMLDWPVLTRGMIWLILLCCYATQSSLPCLTKGQYDCYITLCSDFTFLPAMFDRGTIFLLYYFCVVPDSTPCHVWQRDDISVILLLCCGLVLLPAMFDRGTIFLLYYFCVVAWYCSLLRLTEGRYFCYNTFVLWVCVAPCHVWQRDDVSVILLLWLGIAPCHVWQRDDISVIILLCCGFVLLPTMFDRGTIFLLYYFCVVAWHCSLPC